MGVPPFERRNSERAVKCIFSPVKNDNVQIPFDLDMRSLEAAK